MVRVTDPAAHICAAARIEVRYERCVLRYGYILLHAGDAFDTHVLGDLHRAGAPGCDHLAAGTNKRGINGRCFKQRSISEEPGQLFDCFSGKVDSDCTAITLR